MARLWLLALLFFGSGFSALVFEVVWARNLALLVGSSTRGIAIVTACYMLGLGLGAWLSSRLGPRAQPLRLFAALEGLIALSGLAITLLLPRMDGLFGHYVNHGPLPGLGQFLAVGFILMLPCLSMGASLPILVRGCPAAGFKTTLAALYGVNTLGAALGAFSVDAWLIPQWGVAAAGMVAAGGDGLVALGALLLGPTRAKSDDGVAHPVEGESWTRLGALAFCFGFCGFLAQMSWTRLLVLVNGSDAQAFSLTLSMYLLGLALGSLALLLRPQAHNPKDLPRATWALSLALLASLLSIPYLTALKAQMGEGWPARWACCALLILPSTILLGAQFTLLSDSLSQVLQGHRATARVYLANTLGSVTGALGTGLWLLPWLGLEKCLWGASLLVALSALLLRPTSLIPCILAAGVLVLGGSDLGRVRGNFFEMPGRRILFYGEDQYGIMAVTQEQLPNFLTSHNLVVDGYNMAGDDPAARRYTFLLALAPLIHHGGSDLKCLVVCLGVGNTARAMTGLSQSGQIDCVELSPSVIQGFAAFPHASNLLSQPKFKLHNQDGRNFLLASTQGYDIITAEPPPPKHSGVVNLYSREYYQLCRDRLNPGGVVAQWLPVWQMNRRDVKGVIRAFQEVFPYSFLWEGDRTQLVLTGSMQPPTLRAARLPELFEQNRQVLQQGMWAAPELLEAALLHGPQALRDYVRDQDPLTDDQPFLQYGPTWEPADYAFFYQDVPPPWSDPSPLASKGQLAARRLRLLVADDRLSTWVRLMLTHKLLKAYPGDAYYECITLTNSETVQHWQQQNTPQGRFALARIAVAQGQWSTAETLLGGHTEAAWQILAAVMAELRQGKATEHYRRCLGLPDLEPADRAFLEQRLHH